MIGFAVRYDETLARWQYQDRQGHWSKPMRLHKLTEALQAELVSFEEAAYREVDRPARDPRYWRRSPGIAELQAQVEYEIRSGKVVPVKYSSNRTEAQVQELSRLLELD